MKRLPLTPLLALLLMGQNCEPEPPPDNPGFCYGTDSPDTVLDYLGRTYAAIIDGQVAEDRYGTVRVRFGSSYCSGVIIGAHTVLTAAHCGYAAGYHNIHLDGYGSPVVAKSTQRLPHPEYMKYVQSGNQYAEGRKADIMLLYTDEVLPEPYITEMYNPMLTSRCENLLAQGWGRTEDNPDACKDGGTFCLRETDYTVTEDQGKKLYTKLSDKNHGKICFGDSGGPLYAFMQERKLPMVAGVTSTTYSTDCLTGSTHTSAVYYTRWVYDNVRH
jgi:hypothetical protein